MGLIRATSLRIPVGKGDHIVPLISPPLWLSVFYKGKKVLMEFIPSIFLFYVQIVGILIGLRSYLWRNIVLYLIGIVHSYYCLIYKYKLETSSVHFFFIHTYITSCLPPMGLAGNAFFSLHLLQYFRSLSSLYRVKLLILLYPFDISLSPQISVKNNKYNHVNETNLMSSLPGSQQVKRVAGQDKMVLAIPFYLDFIFCTKLPPLGDLNKDLCSRINSI